MTTSTATQHTYTFADDHPISLELRHHHGDVAVVLDAPEGTAEVTLSSTAPLDLGPVTAGCHRGRVSIDIPALVDPEGGRGFSFSLGSFSLGSGAVPVHVEVHLPHGADVDVSTKRGDIVLQGVSGVTRVRSGSGDLSLEETGRLRAATGSGDVRVGTMTEGSLTTGSGDLELRTATGPGPLEVRSGSGDVTLASTDQDVTVATGSGDVVVHAGSGRFSARTGTGDVQVSVPRGLPVWLDLSSGTGEVRRDIDHLGAPEEGQAHLEVSVRTGTGDITVRHAASAPA